MLKHLDPDAWHVTVVSPVNYFLFQPLLRECFELGARASALNPLWQLPQRLAPSNSDRSSNPFAKLSPGFGVTLFRPRKSSFLVFRFL